MVVHCVSQLGNIEIESDEIPIDLKKMESVSADESLQVPVVHWKNTFNMRPLTLTALTNAKSQSRSVQGPLSRMRCRTITSAAKSLDILRQNLQAAINKEIDIVLSKYLEKFFEPAIRNIKDNLGMGSVGEDLIRDVCKAMLEEAKQMYCAGISIAMNKNPPCSSVSSITKSDFVVPEQVIPARKRKVSDSENAYEQLKKNYPPLVKWDPSRVNKQTQFILSSTANRVFGLGAVHGKLCVKHPELVKYVVDQDDREWLSTAKVPGLIQGTSNVSLMFLEDIVQIVNYEENSSNLCLNELKGFCVPDFMQRKVRAYMTLMRTKYLPNPAKETPQKSKNSVKSSKLTKLMNEELKFKDDENRIQMSVGVGVECLSSSFPPLTLDSGLLELESQFVSLAGLEDDGNY